MKIEDNKKVIKETIKLMKKYNINEEYQKISTVKSLIKIMDKAVEKVKTNKTTGGWMTIQYAIYRIIISGEQIVATIIC